jgi:hypothetical protein
VTVRGARCAVRGTAKGTPTEVDVPFVLPGRQPVNRLTDSPRHRGYLQAGSPSPAVVTIVFAVFTPMPQVNAGICECVTVADQ